MSRPHFQAYLRSLTTAYEKWWEHYAFMDEIDELTWFEFELDSKTQDKPQQPGEKPQEKTQLVLQAIADYADEKILIVGSPGAGKSTLLARIIWQIAQQAQQNEKAPIPVLVELKLYGESGIWELIQTALENCDLYLEILEIKQLVKDRQLLLLADGFNELPTDQARAEFRKFCGRNIPVIVTSRELANDLGLERKLDLQPPSSQQVARFLEARLPNCDRAQLQKLGDRVRDLGQTPLMIWMLYSIFRTRHKIPETRGEAYRAFTTLYAEKAKEGINLTESRTVLSKLAFEMMQSPKTDDPTDFRLDISEVEAQTVLGSEKTLKRLVDFHLLHWQGKPGNRKVRFCHQSLQEYYAAEYLLLQLPKLSDAALQQHYLNYLKRTEAIALMLGLPEIKDNEALRVVALAIGVDLMLGARLAGEVIQKLQKKTVTKLAVTRLSDGQELPIWLKIKLFGITGTKAAISLLEEIYKKHLEEPGTSALGWRSTCRSAELELLLLGHIVQKGTLEQQISEPEQSNEKESVTNNLINSPFEHTILTTLEYLRRENKDQYLAYFSSVSLRTNKENILTLFQLAKHSNVYISLGAFNALGAIGSEEIIPGLIEIIRDPGSQVRRCAAEIIGRLKFRSAIPYLKELIEQHLDSGVRLSAVYALSIIKLEEAIPSLCKAVQDGNDGVAKNAVEALGSIDSEKVIPCLLDATSNPDPLICRIAVHALREISVKEKLKEILSKESVRLAHLLNHTDKVVRQQIVYVLWNIGSKEIIPLLREKLIDDKSDIDLGVALLLGKFGCSKSVPGLLKAMESTDEEVRDLAAYALGQIKGDFTAPALPDLLTLVSKFMGEDALRAIATIQANCKFYNYEIFQAALEPENSQTENPEKTAIAPHYHFPNAQEVKIFENVNTYNENKFND